MESAEASGPEDWPSQSTDAKDFYKHLQINKCLLAENFIISKMIGVSSWNDSKTYVEYLHIKSLWMSWHSSSSFFKL